MESWAVAGVLAGISMLGASCGSASTAVAPSTTDKCGVSVTASTTTVDAGGGRGRLTIETERECSWTATSAVSWITFVSASEGQDDGSVDFAVAPNVDPAPRTGVLTVADRQVSITQRPGACEYQLNFDSAPVPAGGGTRDIEVRASSEACTWTATSREDWIRIRSGASGTGGGRVTLEVTPTTGPPRIGRLVIADRTITVTQADGCNYSAAPLGLSVPAPGGPASISVIASGACPWTATSGVAWITIPGSTASGNGTARLDIAANVGPERTGNVTVAGHQVAVQQASGCSFQVSPRTLSVPASHSAVSVSVTTSGACPWTATSGVSWITIRGSAASDDGTARLEIAANDGPERSGLVTVAGHQVTVQQASGCSFQVSPLSLLFGANGNTHDVSVATAAGCQWTASTNEPSWLILGATGGIGPGTLAVRARANSGPERTGIVLVAGHTVTATQMRYCPFALNPSSASFGPSGGSGSFRVTTDAGCEWRARVIEGGDWVRVTRGADGTGNGRVDFVVAPNPGPSRSTQIMVEDRPFIITQGGV